MILIFFFCTSLWANTPRHIRQYPTNITALVKALEGKDRKMQLYASRELIRQLKYHQRQYNIAPLDSIDYLESKQKMHDIQTWFVPFCMKNLGQQKFVRRCAQAVYHLQHKEALPQLKKALQNQLSFCEKRSIQKAIKKLEIK